MHFGARKICLHLENIYIDVRKNLLNSYVFSIAWYGILILVLGKKEKKNRVLVVETGCN